MYQSIRRDVCVCSSTARVVKGLDGKQMSVAACRPIAPAARVHYDDSQRPSYGMLKTALGKYRLVTLSSASLQITAATELSSPYVSLFVCAAQLPMQTTHYILALFSVCVRTNVEVSVNRT